ncbi:class I SAM-dependent methyltransferase [Clostridium sp. YIM B02569]|uniref:class I SAM-dependent methyltransferase n=1 Tax=Clostridium sp. YIM B02569 TaxID=2911967 RepID=UPI001EECC750|nr:class I SAM-dependent methyltransferase [Clostridium sp. YIM B02569]
MSDKKSMYPWQVDELPFFYKNLPKPTNGDGFPDFLPFLIDIEEKTGVVKQVYNERISEILQKAYIKGSSISGLMDDYGIGEKYAKDFLEFIIKNIGTDNLNGVRILEIGCGTGYLLSLLKGLGADVVGIEPGTEGTEISNKYGISILKDFYPSKKLTEKFDLIISYGVLEHINSTSDFLQSVNNQLNEGGKIFLAVPDCEPYIERGDISMLLHEHYNYFIKDTLYNVIYNSIQFKAYIEKSQFGGFLYGVATNNENTQDDMYPNFGKIQSLNYGYKDKVEKNIVSFLNLFEDDYLKNKSIGIYVPGRIINLFSIIQNKINLKNIRFFDDNISLYNKYFPGINIKIESFDDLKVKSPDVIFIMSNSFNNKIKEKLKKYLGKDLTILDYNDIFRI